MNTKYTKISTTLKEDDAEQKKVLEQLNLINELMEILPRCRILPQFLVIRFTSLTGNAEVKRLIQESFERLTRVVADIYHPDRVLVCGLTSLSSRAKRAVSEKQINGDPLVSISNLFSLKYQRNAMQCLTHTLILNQNSRTISIWPKPTTMIIQLYSISFCGSALCSLSHCWPSAMPLLIWIQDVIQSFTA